MTKFINRALAVLALGFVLGACDKYEIDDHAAPLASGSLVKFYHNSQDSPMLNFYLNDKQVTAAAPTSTNLQRGLAYSSTGLSAVYPVSGYANVASGDFALKTIVPAGSGTTNPAPNTEITSAATTVKFEEKASYSVFAFNKLASLETLVIKDELPATNESKAHMRFVNTMVGAPVNYDLVLVRTDVTPNVSTVVASNVAFKGFTGFTELAPGTYTWYIYPTGTSTTYASGSITLIGGRAFTLLTRGNHVATVTSSTPVVTVTANR